MYMYVLCIVPRYKYHVSFKIGFILNINKPRWVEYKCICSKYYIWLHIQDDLKIQFILYSILSMY